MRAAAGPTDRSPRVPSEASLGSMGTPLIGVHPETFNQTGPLRGAQAQLHDESHDCIERWPWLPILGLWRGQRSDVLDDGTVVFPRGPHVAARLAPVVIHARGPARLV